MPPKAFKQEEKFEKRGNSKDREGTDRKRSKSRKSKKTEESESEGEIDLRKTKNQKDIQYSLME